MTVIYVKKVILFFYTILDSFLNRGGEITKMNFFNIIVVGFSFL